MRFDSFIDMVRILYKSVCIAKCRQSSQYLQQAIEGNMLVSYTIDPQPDVPTGINPKAQCAFEILALNVSAIRAT
jgi:hypothetical protein